MQPATAHTSPEPVQAAARRLRPAAAGALRSPLARDAGALVAAQYAGAALGLVTTVIAARLLGPADYGAAVLAVAYPSVAWSLLAVKSDAVMVRHLTRLRAGHDLRGLAALCRLSFGIDLGAAVAACLAVAALGWWKPHALGPGAPEIASMAALYAASLPLFSLCSTSTAVLAAWRRFGLLAGLQVGSKALALLLALALLAGGLGVRGLVLALGGAQAAAGLAMAVAATTVLRREGVEGWWHGPWQPAAHLWREVRPSLGWSSLAVSAGALSTQLPLILLGRLRGVEEAAFFRLACSLATVVSYPETAAARAVHPVLAQRQQAEAGPDLATRVRGWTLRGGLPAALLVALVALPLAVLIPAVLGAAYGRMVAGTQAMLLGVIVSLTVFWVQPWHYASGRVARWAGASIVHALAVGALSWLAAPRWGFAGVAAINGAGRALLVLALALPGVASPAGRRRCAA